MSMIRREIRWELELPLEQDLTVLGQVEEDGVMYLSVERDGEIVRLRMNAVDRVIVTDNAQEF